MVVDVEFSDTEKEAINSLRKRMTGEMETEMLNDDYLLLRFIKGRDFNIDNTEKMLRNHLEWREKNDTRNILNFKKTEVMENYIPHTIIGYDKEGCVIRYSDVGNMDVRGLFSSTSSEELCKVAIYETELDTEELKKQSKKVGRNVEKCIYIYKMENFSFVMATDKRALSFVIFLMELFMNNYPERLKEAHILCASTYFNILFTVVKNILSKTMLSKIHLYSDDSYKEELLKVIDADVLPAFLGGNRTDPDGNPLCLTFVKHGKPIPESYYTSERKKALEKAADVQKITLSRAAFHEVSIEVNEPGSYLEWEFETKCRDIGFGLFYQEVIDGEEKNTEIVPIQRIDTKTYPETGTFKCSLVGTYVIVFDNTYSWVRAKEIYYRANVVSQKEYESDR